MNRMYADDLDILILPVKYIVEEYVETLWQDPGALVLHDPVLHLPQPLLLLGVAQGHYCPHQVFKIFHVLE